MIIIDEYDAAIMRLMHEKEQLEAMRTMLREFYQVLKDEGAYIRFVFITGVTKYARNLEVTTGEAYAMLNQ